jgi:hypothetical protein
MDMVKPEVKRYTFRDHRGRCIAVRFRTELPDYALGYPSMTITKIKQHESVGQSNTIKQTHQTSEGNTRTPLERID